ncbi:hypothetical protein [Ichthyobacterium seriolicida]|uniref:Uncharacterized protein n=1 Tax=Ichthyobacterium seriolicida TaxID=242600 RepID=A0A1J1DXY5_9FLAO|nr:hypothetical protein [Ichthyobacterium seriolicida]BAV94713.1 hypothetical protein JBKA6_0700 [Ichthyobacterium seriolicida]
MKFPKNNDSEITLTGLTPTITYPNGCNVSPASGIEVTGDISVNGHNTFTLTTSLGSKRVYTVQTVKGPFINLDYSWLYFNIGYKVLILVGLTKKQRLYIRPKNEE